jgi:hypothetical protein
MRPCCPAAVALAAALAVGGVASAERTATPARAGDWVLGVAPAYAYIVLDSKSQPKGAGANAVVLYGLTDSIAARLSLGWSGHSIEPTGTKPNPLYQVMHGMLGLRYSFDLVSVNAAIEGGVGVLYQRFGRAGALDLGGQLGVGLDYWILRWLSLGAFFHYYAFLSNPTKYPVYFDAGPRVEVKWP